MSFVVPLSEADRIVIASGFHFEIKKQAVIAGLTDRSYTGQIVGQGSRVKIIKPIEATLQDYVPDTTVITPENVDDDALWLEVDQAKYWAVKLDDVKANAGQRGELEAVATAAGRATALAVDEYIASVWAANAGVDLGTDVDVSGTGAAYDYLLDTTVSLADQGSEMVAFVPTAFKAQLLRDHRFVGTGFTAQYSGQVGQVAGIAVVETNVQGADTILVRSTADAIASVVSLDMVEMYRPESSFADAVKALIVYGAKVVRPSSAAAGTVVYTTP